MQNPEYRFLPENPFAGVEPLTQEAKIINALPGLIHPLFVGLSVEDQRARSFDVINRHIPGQKNGIISSARMEVKTPYNDTYNSYLRLDPLNDRNIFELQYTTERPDADYNHRTFQDPISIGQLDPETNEFLYLDLPRSKKNNRGLIHLLDVIKTPEISQGLAHVLFAMCQPEMLQAHLYCKKLAETGTHPQYGFTLGYPKNLTLFSGILAPYYI